MAASTPTRREFCRRLFRLGGATSALRHQWLDALSDSSALQQQGGAIVSTSANGASVSFQLPSNWSPNDAPGLLDAARAWADAADVTAALALIGGPIRYVSPDFSGLRA